MGSVPLHGGTRKLKPPSNKNLEIAEDVAGVAGQQNAAPPWGFACLVDFVESTSRTGSMFFLSRAIRNRPLEFYNSRFRNAPSAASAASLCLVRAFTDEYLHYRPPLLPLLWTSTQEPSSDTCMRCWVLKLVGVVSRVQSMTFPPSF